MLAQNMQDVAEREIVRRQEDLVVAERLIIAGDRVVIERQMKILLVVFSLPIHPTDHEQVRKHLERIIHQMYTAALAMVNHMHSNWLNSKL